MSLFSGIGAAIGNLVAHVAPIIGPAVSAIASFVTTKLPEVLHVATVCINAISTVVTSIAELLKISPPGEQAAELGAKVMQDDVRPKKEGELTEEYLEYLRSVPLDKEKFDNMTEEEKLGCEAVGDAMLAEAIHEKTSVELTGEFLMTIPKTNLGADMVYNLIKEFSRDGIDSMDHFNAYLAGDIKNEEFAQKVGDAVKNAINSTFPEMTPSDIQREIQAMRNAFNADDIF